MDASTFYTSFEREFAPVQGALPALQRLAGKQSRWKLRLAEGELAFAFATNLKAAGLLPQMPGEFRLRIAWRRPGEARDSTHAVSLFQYTTAAENAQYAELQRTVLEKYLAQPDKESLRALYAYASDPGWLPRPNIEEWCYYFDLTDAAAWGAWYRSVLPAWTDRFRAAPESNEDWAWRVLWPHLQRDPK